MDHQKSCLIYIAGDVTNYSLVNYSLDGKNYDSFFSAHALWDALKTDKAVALLPDSLITTETKCKDDVEVLKKAYKNMLRDRASQLQSNSPTFDQFLNELEVEYIPNVGVGNSKVTDCNENLVTEEKGGERRYKTVPYTKSRSPTFIYNTIYAVLNKYSRNYEKFIIDLTHGTNVLVSALLAVSTQFDAEVYAAPIMGAPSGTVEIVKLNDIIEAMKDALKINLSIEKLDERYLVDYTRKLRDLIPSNFDNYKDLIGRIKSTDLNKVNDFLWNLRNGFVVKSLDSMKILQQYLQQLESDVSSLSKIYEEWYNKANNAFQKDNKIVLSNFISTLKVKDVINYLNPGSDDVEKMLRILDKYIDVEYYDKALSLGRELPVAECMSNHGGGKFDDNDRIYKNCDDFVTNYLKSKHSELLQYRNYLMHSGLSIDLKVEVTKDRRITQGVNIDKSNIINYVKGSLKHHVEDVRRVI
ncbi:MAG: hypothetical protein OWQ54_09280 [Sulfolobaceae archaeon]|nr:hypothetical protein [Sulfolobaceae archaeon]